MHMKCTTKGRRKKNVGNLSIFFKRCLYEDPHTVVILSAAVLSITVWVSAVFHWLDRWEIPPCASKSWGAP